MEIPMASWGRANLVNFQSTLFLIPFFHHLLVPYKKNHSLLEGIRISKIEHFQSSLINILFHSEGGLNNSAEECSFVSSLPALPDGCTQQRVWPGPAPGALLQETVTGTATRVSLCWSRLEECRGAACYSSSSCILIDIHMMAFADYKLATGLLLSLDVLDSSGVWARLLPQPS